MSLLTMLQDAAREIPITAPISIVGSSDEQSLRLLALAHREGKELRSRFSWPQLQREKTITTVAGQESYALPPDLERFTFNAEWDRTNHWELLGPSSPQEWQWRKSGVSASVPRYRFRIKGVTNNRVFIDPTPATSGIVLVFEYVSTNWILPVTWTTGTVFLANKYCSYNGNIYSTSGGGVTGGTPPTHSSGSVSDGGVTWAFFDGEYSKFLADTDTPVINELLVGLGVQWRFLRSNNLEYESRQAEYEQALKRECAGLKGAPELTFGVSNSSVLLGTWSLPDSGYGV